MENFTIEQTNLGTNFLEKFHNRLASFDFKGALDKCNIIPNFFQKKVRIFIPLEVLAWVMTACWVLRSRLIYFWRNLNISSIFYFSKSTSINTQYSSLWDTLEMMLFIKYLIKWKPIGRISWNFLYWSNLKSSMELDIKRLRLYLSNAPLNTSKHIIKYLCLSMFFCWWVAEFGNLDN